jgi:AcrR family transcriptional regulator
MNSRDAVAVKKRERATPRESAARAAPAKKDSEVAQEAARPYHHGNLREELIRRGKLRLKDLGAPDLSLRQIAADAGVSQVAPKHHFGNKEGLLAAIAASGFRDLTEFRYSRMKPNMSAEQRLRVVLSSYVHFATLNPALFHLMFSPQFKPQDHAELIESASQSYQLLAHAAAEFLKESGRGTASPTAADDAARMGWISMHGLATLMMEHRINPLGAPRYGREQLIERTLDMVFASIRTL